MRLTFKKQKFKKEFSMFLSLILTWVFPTTVIIGETIFLQSIQKQITANPFDFSKIKIGNIVLLALWFGSPVLTFFFWKFTKLHFAKEINGIFTYTISVFLITLIPLFIINPSKTTTQVVSSVVMNTKVFFIAFYIALIVGFITNLYVSQELLKKSNWWLFIIALPYMITSFLVINSQRAFISFTQYSDFSYKNVSRMLTIVKQTDVRYMNPLWYESISLVIVSMLVVEGVYIGALIWQKTERWRQTGRPEEKETNKYRKKKGIRKKKTFKIQKTKRR